jgi:chromosome condensin MukBEF ATPase and DNA-binding subunit MukB
MIKKETEMTEFEKNCYGMTQEDIREQYMESITAKLSGLEMVVMGMLSDSQEMLNTDYFSKEDIRKQLNKAKFILSEMMEAKRV